MYPRVVNFTLQKWEVLLTSVHVNSRKLDEQLALKASDARTIHVLLPFRYAELYCIVCCRLALDAWQVVTC